MIEKILPNLFKIKVPLPNNPLKALNSYVIKSKDRNLIIDTGMNREECLSAMNSGLKEIGVDLMNTDLFITHLHADHLGLASELSTDSSKIYFNEPDANVFKIGSLWDEISDYSLRSGFPENNLLETFQKHPGYKYTVNTPLDFTIIRDGDIIGIDDYSFKCIETPGHSRGHMCLYEPNKKLFISGDHILNEITPNISLWSDTRNPLNQYMNSLDKVYDLDIELVLPGHRSIFREFRKRINELKHHHETRANEILSILTDSNKNAFQIASLMSWDLTYESWDLFPIMQKWFATGETIAHLKYLEDKCMIQREIMDQKIMYCIK